MVSIKAVGMNVKSCLRSFAQGLFVTGVLTGCSSVPDAVNPVEWYKGAADLMTGRDRPDLATPRRAAGQFPDVNATPQGDRKAAASGLDGDTGNAKYASTVKREGAAKTQTARHAAPAAPQSASSPAKAAELPTFASATPSPGAKTVASVSSPNIAQAHAAVARADLGPSAPPAAAPDMAPPARPDIADMGGKRLRPVEEQYQRRLAESSGTGRTVSLIEPAAVSDTGEIHLRPPGGGRGKGMAAAAPNPNGLSLASSSFQVASIDFNGARLTADDRRAITQVATLFRQTGGVIRVLGQSNPALTLASTCGPVSRSGRDNSMERANAVARELTRLGVPARKILVGAAPAGSGTVGAEVFLDI
jgi:outer membrane protein OmpA-like peptidoglycan-associated protein